MLSTNRTQRKFTCIYADRDPNSPSEDRPPPAKRRAVEFGGDNYSPLYVEFIDIITRLSLRFGVTPSLLDVSRAVK
jgi:hypothetical protein